MEMKFDAYAVIGKKQMLIEAYEQRVGELEAELTEARVTIDRLAQTITEKEKE